MKERGYEKDPVFDPDKILFANEFGPVPTREVANEHGLTREFARCHNCHWEEGGTGHVHAHVYEDYLKCGTVCIVGDSHTTVHGAFGCFATGCGSTDMVAVTRYGDFPHQCDRKASERSLREGHHAESRQHHQI